MDGLGAMEMVKSRQALEDRFWEKVELIPFSTCWHWNAAIAKNGYGKFNVGRSDVTHKKITKTAHRLSWEFFNKREIPDGKLACHTCDNRSCVNPGHIFIGTHKDNMQDCAKKGRTKNYSYNKYKKMCKWGHQFTEENTLLYKRKDSNGYQRRCKQCVLTASRNRYLKAST